MYYCFLCFYLLFVTMSSLQDLQAKISELSSKFKLIDDLRSSLNHLSNQHDDLIKNYNKLSLEITGDLKVENASLKAQLSSTHTLAAKNSDCISDLEQYSRRDCLKILGIPKTEDENTDKIVKKVADLIDVDLIDEDISVSHRLHDGIQTRSDGVQQ